MEYLHAVERCFFNEVSSSSLAESRCITNRYCGWSFFLPFYLVIRSLIPFLNLSMGRQRMECIRIRFHPSTELELINRYKGIGDP